MFRPLHPIFLPNEPALELSPRGLRIARLNANKWDETGQHPA
jgi:hypothetical protein